MALTRRLLKGMGLTEEQMDTIIDAHTETVDSLKADLSRYKADAEALAGVRKELEEAKASLENEKKGSWKVKYDALKEEYEGYKAEPGAWLSLNDGFLPALRRPPPLAGNGPGEARWLSLR